MNILNVKNMEKHIGNDKNDSIRINVTHVDLNLIFKQFIQLNLIIDKNLYNVNNCDIEIQK